MRRLPAILLLLLLPAAAGAWDFRTGSGTNDLVLAPAEELPGESLWLAQRIDVQGRAPRDLWLLAAGQVRFTGTAEGDVRLLANSAVIAGEARQNLAAYATGLQIATNAHVGGEVLLVGGNVICEGTVDGDAWILADSATLGGRWNGNVRIQAGEIRVAPGTQIAGDLVYVGSKPLVYDASVTIGGTARSVPLAAAGATFQQKLLRHGYFFLAALLAGMPFVGFFPHVAGGAVRRLRATPGRALLTGAATLLLAPFVIGFAFMTAIGIPVALLAGALYLALAYLSHIVAALWLGHRLLRPQGPQTFARVLAALATGLFVFYFAAAIPGVAAFLLPAVAILGTGALVLALLQRPSFAMPLPPPPPPPVLNPPPEPPQQE